MVKAVLPTPPSPKTTSLYNVILDILRKDGASLCVVCIGFEKASTSLIYLDEMLGASTAPGTFSGTSCWTD